MWRDTKMVTKIKMSQRQPTMLFLNLYNQNNKLWIIGRWMAAGTIKSNYLFSDSGLEQVSDLV